MGADVVEDRERAVDASRLLVRPASNAASAFEAGPVGRGSRRRRCGGARPPTSSRSALRGERSQRSSRGQLDDAVAEPVEPQPVADDGEHRGDLARRRRVRASASSVMSSARGSAVERGDARRELGGHAAPHEPPARLVEPVPLAPAHEPGQRDGEPTTPRCSARPSRRPAAAACGGAGASGSARSTSLRDSRYIAVCCRRRPCRRAPRCRATAPPGRTIARAASCARDDVGARRARLLARAGTRTSCRPGSPCRSRARSRRSRAAAGACRICAGEALAQRGGEVARELGA